MNGDHIFVQHGRGRLGFAREPLTSGAVAGQVRRQHFDGDVPVERRLVPFENGSHASFADDADDLVTSKAPQHRGIVGRIEPGG